MPIIVYMGLFLLGMVLLHLEAPENLKGKAYSLVALTAICYTTAVLAATTFGIPSNQHYLYAFTIQRYAVIFLIAVGSVAAAAAAKATR